MFFIKNYSLNYLETKICKKEKIAMFTSYYYNESKHADSLAMLSLTFTEFGPGIVPR